MLDQVEYQTLSKRHEHWPTGCARSRPVRKTKNKAFVRDHVHGLGYRWSMKFTRASTYFNGNEYQ